MNENIEYLKKLLLEKELQASDLEAKEKVDNLKLILQNDNIFFNIPMDTAFEIFHFLGVPENNMIDLYFKLISPQSYQTLSKEYITISKDK